MPKYKHVNNYILPVGRKTWSNKKYFDTFFELNKERIKAVNDSFSTKRQLNPEKIYNRLTADTIVHGVSFKTAIMEKLVKGTEFRTYAEIAVDNVMSGLKKFDRLDEFYQAITKPDGTMNFNPALMHYDGDGTYTYDNRVTMIFKNSPASVDLIILENEEYEPTED